MSDELKTALSIATTVGYVFVIIMLLRLAWMIDKLAKLNLELSKRVLFLEAIHNVARHNGEVVFYSTCCATAEMNKQGK